MAFHFGSFTLNVGQRRLLDGDTFIPVEPKVFDVLHFLLQNRERVVAREELLAHCWPNAVVSDGTLSRCLSRIRLALGQPRDADVPIQTLHGVGYRFVGNVTTDDAPQRQGTPDVDEPAAAAPLAEQVSGPERRFVAIVDISFAPLGGSMVDRSGDLFDFLQQCRAIAMHHACVMVGSLGSNFIIQAGYPAALEQPALVATAAANACLARADELEIVMRAGVTSGRAILGPVSDSDDVTALLGVSPLRVTGPLGTQSEIFLDQRTADLVRDGATFSKVTRQLATGEDADLLRLDNATPVLDAVGAEDAVFVGRDHELLQLEAAWRKTKAGHGQIATILGQAGIGKSELVKRFIHRAGLAETEVLVGRCSQHHSNTLFYPLLILVRALLGIDLRTPRLEALTKIEHYLEVTGRPAEDHLPMLASLLTVTAADSELSALRLSPQRRYERTMETILLMITAAVEARPHVLWIDDMQWGDRATKETLRALIERFSSLPLMIVLTSRTPVEDVADHGRTALEFKLSRLTRSQSLKLLGSLEEEAGLPARLIDTIIGRSDGVPLYLREITRLAGSRGSAAAGGAVLAPDLVPDSLQGLLLSRLLECGTARPLAQWAAVVGEECPRPLLQMLSELGDAEFDEAMEKLTAHDIFEEDQFSAHPAYSFRHVLMRDAAYGSIVPQETRQRHRKVAETLERNFPEIAETKPELVAVQYEASTRPERAARYWQLAGQPGGDT
ncbi:AAA family ATPase [Acuticoccus sp. MNP-M23]|uniref:AAA family ATPase n=1 Tax=Acuticoccus sp. MNP-M23 TaxID=3072793 RepID=UPI0028158BDC|nr:AAA family ATPase [Acuticoccus sp. MNP-M23]WMS42559.1 AAA family ATPase [Acuticoccus sp. MNP-M23]